MKIAYITSQKKGEIDRLLSEFAEHLMTKGLTPSGIIKDQSYKGHYTNGCDMKVRVLPHGPIIKITQDLGDGSNSCRLDAAALTSAVAKVEARQMDDADLFILNKFGPEECLGRGFCGAIATALELEIPVLVGVSATNEKEFLSFLGGLAEALPDDLLKLKAWWAKISPIAIN